MKFTLLAVASLAFVVVAAVASMRGELRSMLAIAALVGYVYFAGRAMPLWQGRGQPSLHRRAWRRRLRDETARRPLRRRHSTPSEQDCEHPSGLSASR